MKPFLLAAALGLAPMAVSCAHSAPRPALEERAAVEEELAWFRGWWLGPSHVAPPTIEFVPQVSENGSWRVTVTPVRPEDAPWNQWRGGEYRLFNNRVAYLFDVRVDGPGSARWVPDATRLTLNGDAVVLAPARQPDDLLLPLLAAALQQERLMLDGDLVERTRAAGPFRAAYLPLADTDAGLDGVVAFLVEDPQQHVVGMRLTMSFITSEGPMAFSWEYD